RRRRASRESARPPARRPSPARTRRRRRGRGVTFSDNLSDFMRPSRLGAALVLVLAPAAWSQERAVQDTPPIVGTWKLNMEKSTVRVPPGAMEIRQYSLRPDGFLVGLLISGNARDYHYLQFVAKSDGRDYPEYSDQIVGDLIAAGRPTRRTYA